VYQIVIERIDSLYQFVLVRNISTHQFVTVRINSRNEFVVWRISTPITHVPRRRNPRNMCDSSFWEKRLSR